MAAISILSCKSQKVDRLINNNFLCEYFQNQRILDGRNYIIPEIGEGLQKYSERLPMPDSLLPVNVHIWNRKIELPSGENFNTVPDSVSISSFDPIEIDIQAIVSVQCEHIQYHLKKEIPDRNEDSAFYRTEKPTIFVQISDLYFDKQENLGVIHLVYSSGFVDNTFNDIIYFKKDGVQWVIID